MSKGRRKHSPATNISQSIRPRGPLQCRLLQAEVCRKKGISEQSFYHWKKFQGMGVTEVGPLRVLEKESRNLKQRAPDLRLDKQMLPQKVSSLLNCGPRPNTFRRLMVSANAEPAKCWHCCGA